MVQKNYIDLEKPIAELHEKLASLQTLAESGDENLDKAIQSLKNKIEETRKSIFKKLDSWGVQQFARHPDRPYTLDYIKQIFTDFEDIAGDRVFGNDDAMVAGIARLDGRPVVVIGQQKGRSVKEKVKYNFGMPSPEGYRKALRAVQLAARFNMPVITFIDTPGAYPGIGAEERGQAEAIAVNLRELSNIKTPIIVNIIGEGGSGGALAIGVGDKVNMLSNSTYSVISPEGCASILWKSAEKANVAAEALCLTAPKIKELGLIDSIIDEPIGGAHTDYVKIAASLKEKILDDLFELDQLSKDNLVDRRYKRILDYGY